MIIETHTSFHVMKPVQDEMIDLTNRRIRRVLHCIVFFEEDVISPSGIADSMIGQESVYTFPDGEVHTYCHDEVVFTSPHRCRLYLSRPLLMTGRRGRIW